MRQLWPETGETLAIFQNTYPIVFVSLGWVIEQTVHKEEGERV